MRIIKFFDGAESETTPVIGNVKASGLVVYANDSEYEAANVGSPEIGNTYFNSSDDVIRYYDGTNWISVDSSALQVQIDALDVRVTDAELDINNLQSDLSDLGTDVSNVTSDLSAHEADTSAHDATGGVVGTTKTQTLTNKTMDGDSNTFQNLVVGMFKTVVGNANKFFSFDGSGNPIATKTVPTGDVVGTSDTQTLSGKTLTAPTINNPETNIETYVEQSSTPASPAAGKHKFYFKNDGFLYMLDSGGVESLVSSGGGGGSSFQSALPHTSELTGSGTYNLPKAFFVSSASANIGATYTNNSVTFTVIGVTNYSSATVIIMSSSGAPTSSGTLTKASGTGDSTITFTSFRNPLYLHVKGTAGGGGGSGGSNFNPNGGSGGNGGNNTFGTSLLAATGGAGASSAFANGGGAGSGATITAPAYGYVYTGGSGQGWTGGAGSQRTNGGTGGTNIFGGSGGGGVCNNTGTASSAQNGQAAASGSGAGGGGAGGTLSNAGGSGGGAGGAYDAIVPNPVSIGHTFSYSCGSAGSGGSAGTNGSSGGNGGSGKCEVTAHFQ